MVCSNYFPVISDLKKEELTHSTLTNLINLDFPIFSRIGKQNFKTHNKAENDEKKGIVFPLMQKMTKGFQEIIQNKGCFELSPNDDLYFSNKPLPYKTSYTKDDDDFLIETNKFAIEKFELLLSDPEEPEVSNYEKVMAFKQIPIEYYIEMLKVEENELKESNEKKLKELMEKFQKEEKNPFLLDRQQFDSDNILKDLEFLTFMESDFLNYLESKQQQDLALYNLEIYEENKNLIPIDGVFQKSEDSQKLSEITANPNEEKLSDTTKQHESNSPEDVIKNPNPHGKVQHNKSNFSVSMVPSKKPSKLPKLLKDDIVCQVCNDGDYSEDNMIVFCSVMIIILTTLIYFLT